jgi:predicted SAM-dependent methyltransferase
MSFNNLGTTQALGFEEAAYLEANLDVAEAVKSGQVKSGFSHWVEYGIAEKRPLNIFNTRKYKVFHSLDKLGAGLEIGPSHNPIAPKRDGYDVQIVDHASAAVLRDKYKSHGLNLENIEEVDFVWQGQPLSELIGKTKCYDWIIASHVIEHIPDLIAFFKQCSELLKPNGVISLVIPDKRYCFDYFAPLTTTGDLLDAHLQKRQRPSPGKIFDHFSNACSNQGAIAWEKDSTQSFNLIHEITHAHDAWLLAQKNSDYVDVHCWRFTPTSFELIIQDLQQLGLLNIGYKFSFETSGCEFYVSLERKIAPNISTLKSRLDLHHAIRKEIMD